MTSDFVRSKIKYFDLSVDGETVSLRPEKIQLSLPGDRTIQIDGIVQINEPANSIKLGFNLLDIKRLGISLHHRRRIRDTGDMGETRNFT
ncbi:hypothetical protein ACE1AT_11910 [Pelatocladus sp. BLCC-F211]|uniref:hypothetical protein n=1 Tax=Pelatocladus sp. BLCC-F211 TaxID=3342752 RepID=UPI0035B96770